MSKKVTPEYREKEAVDVDLSEKHFKHLRKAYLEGQLTVDSKALAEKIISFEQCLAKFYDQN